MEGHTGSNTGGRQSRFDESRSERVWLRGHWVLLGGRRGLHCAFCMLHSTIHWLGTLFARYRTEIHIAVVFPFYSREFGNEKRSGILGCRETGAPE